MPKQSGNRAFGQPGFCWLKIQKFLLLMHNSGSSKKKVWDKEDKNAYSVDVDKIIEANHNLDFKNPNNGKEEKEYKLDELLKIMDEKAKSIQETIEKLTEELEGVEE